ncbi:MAG: hypothetical protein Q8L24_00600 [bacterium]|nr:hypothetical protein [bacterium]
MGIDLRLFLPNPILFNSKFKDTTLCHEHIDLDRDSEIFEQFDGFDGNKKAPIRGRAIPHKKMPIQICEDEGIQKYRTDPYGKKVRFVYPPDLKCLRLSSDTSPKNKAIKAFIDALPDDTPIILWWH